MFRSDEFKIVTGLLIYVSPAGNIFNFFYNYPRYLLKIKAGQPRTFLRLANCLVLSSQFSNQNGFSDLFTNL